MVSLGGDEVTSTAFRPVVPEADIYVDRVHLLFESFIVNPPVTCYAHRLYMFGSDADGRGIVREPTPDELATYGWMVRP